MGSNPIWTVDGGIGEGVNTLVCGSSMRGFDSHIPPHNGGLAQLGEHLPYKQEVTGSSPVSSICGCGGIGRRARFRILYLLDVRVQVPSSAFGIKTLFQNHIDIGL